MCVFRSNININLRVFLFFFPCLTFEAANFTKSTEAKGKFVRKAQSVRLKLQSVERLTLWLRPFQGFNPD